MNQLRLAANVDERRLDSALAASGHTSGQRVVQYDGAFEIELASTGEVVQVKKGQSAIDALSDIGVVIPTACKDGRCGACLTLVLDGVPLHQDFLLTSDEHAANTQFTPCCSRGIGRLVIDV